MGSSSSSRFVIKYDNGGGSDGLASLFGLIGSTLVSSAAFYYVVTYVLPKQQYPPGPVLYSVTFNDSQYNPAQISARVGDIIEWTNQGTLDHDVVSGIHGGVDPNHAQIFASGPLAPGEKFTWTVEVPPAYVNQPPYNGSIPVHCHIHGLPTGGRITVVSG